MATFLAIPLKKTGEVDVVKPFRSFIQNTFTTANPEDYNTAISEFNKLRNLMINKSVDKHESALEVLYRWVSQEVFIDIYLNSVCLPMNYGHVRDSSHAFLYIEL